MRNIFKNIIVAILTWEAVRVLRAFRPKVIVVSGSVGKTTTKDAIYHILKDRNHARKSEKSYNSELGVPLTILGLPNAWSDPIQWVKNIWRGYRLPVTEKNYPKLLVLEVGSDHPGDIAALMKWLRPNIAVVTCLPDVPVHVEYFKSPEELRTEDGLVVSALRDGGAFVTNADDPHALALMEKIDESTIRTVTYGFSKKADVHATHPTVRYALDEGVDRPAGMQFDVSFEGSTYPIYVNGVLGKQVCSALLAAFAVGIAHGESMLRMADDAISFQSPKGRMRIIEGKLGSTIIDDTYNSSPVALEAALQALRDVKGKRKIAILGDMLELGTFTEEEHWKAGRIAGAFVDELITVGHRARLIAEAGKSAGLPQGHIHEFSSATEAGDFFFPMVRSGDVILLKGSQGSGENMIRLERAVAMLMSHPEEAANQLVRQEEEWQQQYRKERKTA